MKNVTLPSIEVEKFYRPPETSKALPSDKERFKFDARSTKLKFSFDLATGTEFKGNHPRGKIFKGDLLNQKLENLREIRRSVESSWVDSKRQKRLRPGKKSKDKKKPITIESW